MLVKTILNSIEQFKSFVFDTVHWETVKGVQSIVVSIRARANSRPECYQCGQKAPVYDTQRARSYEYVPLWGYKVFFRYAPRRVSCPVHGVLVERVPWAEGKGQMTTTYRTFLAGWAKRLSWLETAQVFRTSWDTVYRAVCFAVEYGLAHRDVSGVTGIGIDEIVKKVRFPDWQRTSQASAWFRRNSARRCSNISCTPTRTYLITRMRTSGSIIRGRMAPYARRTIRLIMFEEIVQKTATMAVCDRAQPAFW